MKDFSARVINNIRYFVDIKREEIWIRRTEFETAQNEFQKLQNEGKVALATFRPEYSCKGSVNFFVEYPS